MPRLTASVYDPHGGACNERILLIDDDELIAGSLRRYLLLRGCECDLASDLELAGALMEVHRYSVVVVDPYLTGAPGGEADALLATIATLQPGAAVIVATAYASPQLARRAHVVEKPQPIVALTQLILRASAGASQTHREKETEIHA